MTSATLEHLWEKHRGYQPEKGSLRQWIVTMAQNLAKDMLKSRRHKSRLLQAQSGYDGLAAERREGTPYPREEERHLDEILAGLPAQDREIILEHSRTDGAGRWAAELAERLGIRASTIRVKRGRAHERIKQAFRARGFKPAQRGASRSAWPTAASGTSRTTWARPPGPSPAGPTTASPSAPIGNPSPTATDHDSGPLVGHSPLWEGGGQ
jgi:RNA polymerase sigma factor (sigma-70 family)